MKKQLITKYSFLLFGSLLLAFTGLRYTFFLVAWVPMIFFIYYFRKKNKWYEYLIIIALLFTPKLYPIHGAWSMSISLELLATLYTITPILISLLVDKYFYKKGSIFISTLIFPTTNIIIDLLLSLSRFGNFSSIAITQFNFKPLIQIAAITGLGGISFMIFWFSSIVATLWENDFNLKKYRKLSTVFMTIFVVVLLLGGISYTVSIPTGKTVKIAGITVEHKSDYWDIVDMKTPQEEAGKYAEEIGNLNDELFEKSEKAAKFGAKIIFWSEANGVIYAEDRENFMIRSQDFAKENQVYFAPTMLVLKYDTFYAENKIIMINPNGEIEFEYEKTISWYPTKSDGIIKTVETPFGKIGSVICFDADFPRFVRQAAQKNVDILIIPKFDTQFISPGHTYAGLFRGIEYGFSMICQVNEGISMAEDYRGNILAYQDFFTTKERIMIADLPIKGRKTIYAIFGDWFVYLCVLFLILIMVRKGWAKWHKERQ